MAYLESLRRNEAEHRALLEAWLRAHGEDPATAGRAGAAKAWRRGRAWTPTPSAGTR